MHAYWIWLSTRPGVTDRMRVVLLEHFPDAYSIYSAQKKELDTVAELSEEAKKSLLDKDLQDAHRVLKECEKKNLHILTAQDADYPDRLKNIYDPPAVLYYKGILPDFDSGPTIGVVGTRHPSGYGRDVAYRLGYELGMCGGLVVSGMAMGIDAAAMDGALAGGKPVVGVLGCGADMVYPRCNSRLFADAERCGCILSEFAPGTKPSPWNFPRRNRIISGLSCGVVVVEAPEKSGSLITANQAAEQGRDVFAVPGNIDMSGFVGSNRLLRNGAIMVSTGWDILSEYETLFPEKIRRAELMSKLPPYTRGGMPEQNPEKTKSEKVAQHAEIPVGDSRPKDAQNKKAIDNGSFAPYIDLTDTLAGLSPDEQAVVTALGEEEKLVDDVIAASGLNAGKVLSILTMLEIKGIVSRHPGRRISLKAGEHSKRG